MAGQGHNGIQCSEFDALLSQAIDGTLLGDRLEAFEAHGRECRLCGPMLRDAAAGRSWLKSLGEVEPPAQLVNNILLATSGVASGKASARATWGERIGRWIDTIISPVVSVARQPRFVMSFGMAFFTLSVTLTIAGINAGDVWRLVSRPSTIRRTYYEAQGRVVKYYENIRFVYEIESRVRQLKQAAPVQEQPATEQKKPNDTNKKNSSGEPNKEERNYSQEGTQVLYAALPRNGDAQPAVFVRAEMVDSPVVQGATYRRFV